MNIFRKMFEKSSRGDTADVPTHVLPDALSFVVLPMMGSATILKFRAVSQATQIATDRGLLTAAAPKTFVAPQPCDDTKSQRRHNVSDFRRPTVLQNRHRTLDVASCAS